MLKYINQIGSKKNTNNGKSGCICTYCAHEKQFVHFPSMKTTKRCGIYHHKTEGLHYRQCKYYNNKRKFELTIGV